MVGGGGQVPPVRKFSSANGKAVGNVFHIINYSANRELKLGAARFISNSGEIIKKSINCMLHFLLSLNCIFNTFDSVKSIKLTLPVDSTKCERSFSKLKIKNQLRQITNKERLEERFFFFLSSVT